MDRKLDPGERGGIGSPPGLIFAAREFLYDPAAKLPRARGRFRFGVNAMGRKIATVVAGVAAWFILVSAIDIAMRRFWPDYAANFTAMTFTLPMMIARLSESTVALVVAALLAARMAPGWSAAAASFGVVMLVIFLPIHYSLWSNFPVWYHAYFLTSLLVAPAIVGWAFARRGARL